MYQIPINYYLMAIGKLRNLSSLQLLYKNNQKGVLISILEIWNRLTLYMYKKVRFLYHFIFDCFRDFAAIDDRLSQGFEFSDSTNNVTALTC